MHPLYYPVLMGHGLLTLFMALGWISNNQTVLKILFITLIIGLVLFYINRGCCLTRLERKLSGSDFTIIDPLLSFLNIEIDRQTRTQITMGIFILSLTITTYKLFIRPE